MDLPTDAVILATGGARGITAEILRPFAKPGVTLVLIGRSPLPLAEDGALAAVKAGDLRKHLLAEAKAKGEAVTPAGLEKSIGAILRDREIRANIADLTGAGAFVDYRTADMGDPGQVAGVMAAILADHPKIHGVIHGAGVIEDKKITDKTQDSWNRVVLPKVLGALALARALDHARPMFFSVFASVAGRFGNSGQTDYAAANEMMNRLAGQLQTLWPQTRCVAVNWGPWDSTRHGAGMVSDAVRLKFEAQDVTLVNADGGAEAFHDEMLRGPIGVTDVVLGAGPWERHEAERGMEAAVSTLPLLPAPRQEPGARGGIKVPRVLDLTTDPWLGEHRIGGVPVLPLACATELCAEAAAFIWDDWQVTGLSDLRALAGLRLEGDQPLAVDLLGMGSEHADATGFFARVELRGTGEKARAHYRASVQRMPKGSAMVVDEEALAAAWELLRYAPAGTDLSARKVYREMLFHGPSFQLMKAVEGIDARGMAISVKDSRPGSFGPGGWFFDPGLLDTAAQLAWVWSMVTRGSPALPNAIGRALRLGPGAASRMVLRLRPEAVAPQVLADVVVADATGHPVLLIEALEATSDAGLNRFCGWNGDILADVTDKSPAEAAE
jgi:NAD(P)-dependent dehydrogenase (short-subunit alcohol dehydrogenase family)